MSVTIRLTINPADEIVVSDSEYENLQRLGLVFGEAVPAPEDPADAQVASLIENETSATWEALRGVVVPFWAPSETVAAGAVRMTALGVTITRNSSGTTRASYDATEAALWTVSSGSDGGGGTVPDASTTVKGIVELATDTETTTGTDTARAVTPAGVTAAILPKAPYRAAPSNPPGAPVKVVSTCDSGWSQISGTVTHDTTIFETGAGSLKITAPSDSSAALASLTLADQDWSKSAFSMRLRFDDWSKVLDLYMIVSTSGSFSQIWRMQLTPRLSLVPNGEWFEVTFTREDLDFNSGSANWSTVNGIRFQLYGTSGNTPTMWVDQIVRYPTPSRPTISICFDDGYDTTATVGKPKMDQYGFRGTLFAIPDRVNQTGYVSQAQIDTLAQAGWDISGHGDTSLISLSLAAAEADVAATKKYLVDRGYKGADVFAYPNDGQNFAVRTMVAKYFSAARGLVGLGQTRTYVPRRRFQSAQPGLAWTVSQLTAKIDTAIANNSWLVISFHRNPVTASAGTDFSAADFGTVIDYIAATGALVLPVSEALAAADEAPQIAALGVPQARSGLWAAPSNMANVTATALSGTSGQGSFAYVDIAKATTINALGVHVTTAAVGGAAPLLQFGLFADDGTGYPGALVVDGGSVAPTSTGLNIGSAISQTLQPGRYWIGVKWQFTTVPTTLPQVLMISQAAPSLPASGLNQNNKGYAVSGLAAGAWSGSAPAGMNVSGANAVMSAGYRAA